MAEEVQQKFETLSTSDQVEDDVNPWSVTSSSDKGVDYDKLVSKKNITDCSSLINVNKEFF